MSPQAYSLLIAFEAASTWANTVPLGETVHPDSERHKALSRYMKNREALCDYITKLENERDELQGRIANALV